MIDSDPLTFLAQSYSSLKYLTRLRLRELIALLISKND